MNTEPTSEDVEEFLTRVMAVEERYAFAKKAHESAKKDELRNLLDEFCKTSDKTCI